MPYPLVDVGECNASRTSLRAWNRLSGSFRVRAFHLELELEVVKAAFPRWIRVLEEKTNLRRAESENCPREQALLSLNVLL